MIEKKPANERHEDEGEQSTPSVLRLLIVEDNTERMECFRAWLPADVHPVWATSAGRALGILHRSVRDDRDWARRSLDYSGILLDHDLVEHVAAEGEECFSGTHVAAAIIERISRDVPILIHSVNQSRAKAMETRLRTEEFDVRRIPMTVLTRELLLD